MRALRWILFGLVAVICLLALTLIILPWKDWLGGWMTALLQGQGVPVEAMQLKQVTPTYMDFADVTLRTDPPLVLPTLRVNYTKATLLARRVSDIEIRDVDYHLGLKPKETAEPDSQPKPLPSPQQLAAIPIERVVVTDSRITLGLAQGEVELPFTASLKFKDNAEIAIGGSHAVVTLENGQIQIPDWSIKITAPDNQWAIDSILLEGPAVQWTLLEKDSQPAPLDIPMPDLVADLPVQKILISEATVNVTGSGIQVQTGFDAEMRVQPSPKLEVKGAEATVTPKGADGYRIAPWEVELAAKENLWQGRITLPEITSMNSEETVKWLPVAVIAKPVIDRQRVSVPVEVIHEKFRLNATVNMNAQKQIKLEQAALDVAEGTVRSVSPIVIEGKDILTKLSFEHISLEPLLEFVLGEEEAVKATGRVSGMVPIGYKGGMVTIGTGSLTSETKGVLSLGADQLGDFAAGGEQVQQVAQLIQHFEYDSLELTTNNIDGSTSFKVALKGRNPEVYAGSEVHLNINLQGDVIEAITAYLGLYKLPEQLLKGNVHEQE